MNVGNKIDELRKNLNITMQQLSDLTGISQPVLSKLETGNRIPDVPTIEKICTALGITLSEFFNEDKELQPDLAKLIQNAKTLHPDLLNNINDLIETLKKNYRSVKTNMKAKISSM